MIDRAIVLERSLTLSPLQVDLTDMFRKRPPRGPLVVTIERVDGATVTPISSPARMSTTGQLAFVGLGRSSIAGEVIDLRITVTAPDMVQETTAGTTALELSIVTWNSDSPPPGILTGAFRFYPATSYTFGPGVPILNGIAVDPAGDPLERASIFNEETVRGQLRTEEVRTGPDGRFRLPLRWSFGPTLIHATHPSGSTAEAVNLPADLTAITQLVLS